MLLFGRSPKSSSGSNLPAKMFFGCILASTTFIMLGVTVAPPARQISLPGDALPTCTVSASEFASWFESGAPSLNGVVNPADSVNFPDIPNCSFYRWSEQMFLWLTSPAPPSYGGGKHIFDSPVFFDVSAPDANGKRKYIRHVPGKIRVFNLRAAQVGPHGLPVVMSKTKRMFEVQQPKLSAAGRPLILNDKGRSVEIGSIKLDANRKPIFMDKGGRPILKPKPLMTALPPPQIKRGREVVKLGQLKIQALQKFMVGKIPIFLDLFGNVIDVEQGQAGGRDVLQAQNGSLVYYATMVNDVYAYFQTGTKNGSITPAPTQFPTTQTALNKVIAYAATKGKTFPDPEALAIEVKSSWVEASGLPNLSDYITMKATIPTYNTSNPNSWTPNGQKTVTLALTGMHVVGSTKGHPEMIWATFEHFGNAPSDTYQYNSSTGLKTVTRNTAGNWLFCASNSAGPFNVAHMRFSSPNIVSTSGHTITPSDTLRMKAWGGAFNQRPNPLDASTAASNTEVIAINNSVISQLIGADIRKNYIMTGSTWTIGGASPSGSFNLGNEVGTSMSSNATMETYQQGSNNLFSTGSNCFSCHGTNTTFVSHIFDSLIPLF